MKTKKPTYSIMKNEVPTLHRRFKKFFKFLILMYFFSRIVLFNFE